MSEKSDKLRAMLEKEKERRIKLNNRIEILERRIQEAEAAEVNEMVRTAKVTPEQLAALLRQSATSTPNPAASDASSAEISDAPVGDDGNVAEDLKKDELIILYAESLVYNIRLHIVAYFKMLIRKSRFKCHHHIASVCNKFI